MTGLFVTFEGIEGCGKTTQLQKLSNHLKCQNYQVVATREPGGTVIGDSIRTILLNPSHQEMSPLCELFLYEASRIQLLTEVIKPAMSQGAIDLCDRFTDSSLAYQGYGRGIPLELIKEQNRVATVGIRPQLTFLFDLPVEEGFKRIAARQYPTIRGCKEDRLEREDLAFHERVRKGFLDLAEKEPERIAVIDAREDEGQIFKAILSIIKDYVIQRDSRAR